MTNTMIREAAAIAATLLLARLAQLRFDGTAAGLPLSLRNYLQVSTARLLLMPSIVPAGSDTAAIGAAAQQLGHDALVVRAAGRDATSISFEVCTIEGKLDWSPPLQLWNAADGAVHLVPEQPDAPSYTLLASGVHRRDGPPWTDAADHEAALLRAQHSLVFVLESY